MTTHKDYYDVLGVPRTATGKEIKAAYRRLARKHHPDVNRGDKQAEERFKEVAEAFAVLSDPEKRARYDRGGREAFGPGFDPFAGFDVGEFDFGGADLSSLFEMFGFGGRGGGGRRTRRARPRGGEDLRVELRVPFERAVLGGEVEIRLPGRSGCATCGGSGLRAEAAEASCDRCGGSGRAGRRQGAVRISTTCPACGGSGRSRGDPCGACGGRGWSETAETMRVRIPAGIDDGGTLRLPGKGYAGGPGAPRGDAYLVVRVESHPHLRREGRDLYRDVAIGVARAVLGGRVQVETPGGTATITIPPGTRSGQKFRLRGRGVPGSPAGDFYAVIQIHPPKELDEKSRELMEAFAELEAGR